MQALCFKGCFLSCLAFLVPLGTLKAEDVYVRPGYTGGAHTGADWNNAWNGFSGIVWGTGAGKLGPGDTCWLAGGVYTSRLLIGANGTAGSPIMIKRVRSSDSVPSTAAGWSAGFDAQVLIQPTATAQTPIYFNAIGDYTTVDGQIPSGIKVILSDGCTGCELDGSHNFTDVLFRYIEVAGPGPITQTGDTRAFDLTPQGTLTNISVSHCIGYGGDTILQAVRSTNLTVEYCEFYLSGCLNSATFHPNTVIFTDATNMVIRYNVFHDNDVEGVFPESGTCSNIYIYGNLWYQGTRAPDTGRGIENGTAAINGIYIYNNTFVDLPNAAINLPGGGPVSGADVRNNVFVNCKGVNYPSASIADYNFYSGTAPAGEAHSVSGGTAPFVNAAAHNYRLTSAISATVPRNKGVSLGAPYDFDLDGNQRGADGSWDMGAYEYTTGGGTGNTAPTITPVANQSGTSGVAAGPYAFTVGDAETAVNSLTVSGVSSNLTVLPSANIVFGGSGANRTVTLSPAAGQTGTTVVTLTVSDGVASASSSFSLTVMPPANTAPTISTQPASLAVTTGAAATFAVVGTGNPLPTYQWQKAGASIAGATNSSYSIASTVAGDAAAYTVVLTNTAGSVTSSAAVLTVTAPVTLPTITTQPTSVTAALGSSATFTVAATGNPTPTYQWRKAAANITGATNASFTIASVVLADAASYTVRVTNSQGTVTSSAATLTIPTSAPVITTQPANLDVSTATPATFTVVATGNPAPTYQWKKGGVNIAGATSASYTIASTVIGSAGSYTVAVSNSAGSVTSSAAVLSVKTLGDFNGDGKADILLTNTTTGERAIWLMNGATITAGASLGLLPTAWSFEGTGDFDGDGKADIILTNTVTGERAIWLMNGTTISAGASLGVLALSWTIDGIGDFNGDGKSDLVLTNTVTAERVIWLMNGTSISAGASLGTLATDWVISGTGDFDGDGKCDLVLSNSVTGARALWLMNGTAIKSGISLGMTSTDWVINGTGDFNGDGKTDLILTSTVTGERSIWLINGTSFNSTSLGVLPTAWVVAKVGDFNGDGKADIFLTNTVTGDRAVWMMNGAVIGSGLYQGLLATAWLASY